MTKYLIVIVPKRTGESVPKVAVKFSKTGPDPTSHLSLEMIIQEYTDIQNKAILDQTQRLMTEAGISVRDTWYGYDDINLDDYKSHGNKWNEPKLFSIVITDKGKPISHHQCIYDVPFHSSIAYDKHQIAIPVSHLAFTSTLVHECVHFLQHETEGSIKAYVAAKKNNYEQYLSQRSELEAHFVQLMYIVRNEIGHFEIDLRAELHNILEAAIKDPVKRMSAILDVRNQRLI